MEMISFLLILVGVVIVGAVFAVRFRRPPAHEDYTESTPRRDPLGLDAADDWDVLPRISARNVDDPWSGDVSAESDIPPSTASRVESVRPEVRAVAQGKVKPAVLHVMASDEGAFGGPALLDALRTVGMGHGDMGIFHYYAPGRPSAPPLFSLANVVKPGNFDLNDMDGFSTKGLALFMLPAGCAEDVEAYDSMLETAEQLAEILGGEVRDERRSALTRQGVELARAQLQTDGMAMHAPV